MKIPPFISKIQIQIELINFTNKCDVARRELISRKTLENPFQHRFLRPVAIDSYVTASARRLPAPRRMLIVETLQPSVPETSSAGKHMLIILPKVIQRR